MINNDGQIYSIIHYKESLAGELIDLEHLMKYFFKST